MRAAYHPPGLANLTDVDVSGDGEFFIVGAKFDDDAGSSSGGVYIFERSGSSFREEQKLVPSTLQQGDQLGRAVAIDGDIAVVWTPYDFWVGDERRHGGIDIFNLLRTDDGWKVASVTWTSAPTAPLAPMGALERD